MWWQSGTIYQIYPRSFQDSDGDGIGDLEGIRRRLPYLRDLGIDAIWLSPVFRSPMRDFGYDIADYRAIDPLFGTMADFERLLEEAHGLGLKLLLDFVPNHTSDDHPWFVESASSRHNPRRDWYVWADPGPGGGPPNNWLSEFGGGAWQWHEATGQYYCHSFLASQPDLNWRNPAVRREMWDTMRFWLDKGVDGFRVDVIWHLIKDDLLRDDPPNPDFRPGEPDYKRHRAIYSADRPAIHEVVAEMRAVIDEYDERLLIGEIYLPLQRMVAYYGEHGRGGVHFPFNFLLLQTPWRAEDVARAVEEYEAALPGAAWPDWVISNHDRPRAAARAGEHQAANAALLLLTLRGTPTLYYGDELGIGNVPIAPDRVRDPWALQEPGSGLNRDASRTPMQWSDAEYAGFSTAEPWLPLTEDWRTRNVERMSADESSLLSLYRRLLALRRREPALNRGAYRRVLLRGPVLAYERAHGEDRFVVVLNFSAEPQTVELPVQYARAELVLSTLPDAPDSLSPIELRPGEGLLLRV